MLARTLTLANDTYKNRVFITSSTISLAAAVQMSVGIAKESWQRKWWKVPAPIPGVRVRVRVRVNPSGPPEWRTRIK